MNRILSIKVQMRDMKKQFRGSSTTGAIGWALLWLIGIPIPILLVIFLMRGCT